MLMVNIRSVLMDPSHWGDPEIFRPERFIDADGNFKKDEHLILFGTGLSCGRNLFYWFKIVV